jgi:hypothetical protein
MTLLLVSATAVGMNGEQQIVIENHPPADSSSDAIPAAIITGVFALAGVMIAKRRKS